MKNILLAVLAVAMFVGCDIQEEVNRRCQLETKALTKASMEHPETVGMLPDGRILKFIKAYRSPHWYASVYYFESPNTKVLDTNTISINYQEGKSYQTIVLDGREYNLTPK